MDYSQYRQFYIDNGYLPMDITWYRLPEYLMGVIGSESFISDIELDGADLNFTGIGDAFNGKISLTSLIGEGVLSTGFERITENGNSGLRIIGVNPTFYGDIGNEAVDGSIQNFTSTTRGATGDYSVAFGVRATASGIESVAIGGSLNEGQAGSTASGQGAIAIGSKSFAIGDYSTAFGTNAYANGFASVAFIQGTSEEQYSFAGPQSQAYCRFETAFGQNPTVFTATNTNTDRLFTIGNGGLNGPSSSNAFNLLRNGLATLPSVTNTLIDASGTGKEIATVEWVNAQGFGLGSGFDETLNYNPSGIWNFSGKITVPSAVNPTDAVNLSQLEDYAKSELLINSETITSRSFDTSDINGTNVINNAGNITMTVPTNAVMSLPIGSVIHVQKKKGSTGKVTIAYSAGVTGESLFLYTDHDEGSLVKTGTNTWIGIGFPKYDSSTFSTSSDVVSSDITGEPTGSDAITNIVSLTQAEYDAGTPIATTFYIITDA